MHAASLRGGDTSAAPEPAATKSGMLVVLARLLDDVVRANARPLPSRFGELPPEWFHYPPF
jgi:hypothetical protein